MPFLLQDIQEDKSTWLIEIQEDFSEKLISKEKKMFWLSLWL